MSSGPDQSDSPDPYPDASVIRVEIEHGNGTVKRLVGDEAQEWASKIDAAVGEATMRGRDMPQNVPWDTWKRFGGNDE